MLRVHMFLLLGMMIAGCASLGVRTEGTSGPIAWHVTDLKSASVPRDAPGTYSFTLVLKETQGTPITFTYRKDTIYASNITVLNSEDRTINLRFRPHEERRFPLTFSWSCAGGIGDCRDPGSVAPMWTINLTGTDEKGNPVKAVINIKLPHNPDTYRKP
jgi:hypothetical protein